EPLCIGRMGRIEVGAVEVAVIRRRVDVDREALSEAEFEVAQTTRVGRHDPDAEARKPQEEGIELAIISEGVSDLRYVACTPTRGVHRSALSAAAARVQRVPCRRHGPETWSADLG